MDGLMDGWISCCPLLSGGTDIQRGTIVGRVSDLSEEKANTLFIVVSQTTLEGAKLIQNVCSHCARNKLATLPHNDPGKSRQLLLEISSYPLQLAVGGPDCIISLCSNAETMPQTLALDKSQDDHVTR